MDSISHTQANAFYMYIHFHKGMHKYICAIHVMYMHVNASGEMYFAVI